MGRGGTPVEAWEGRPREHWRSLWGVPALELYGQVTSTNDIARDRAEAGAPEGTVVLADHQTAGRGRGERPWLAPPGRALLLSIVLRPATPVGGGATPGVLPLLGGRAGGRAVGRAGRAPAGVTWAEGVGLA